jgi:large subunit ribosomal protein L21e
MVKSSKGFNSRTRGVLTKEVRDKGSPPPTHYLRVFEEGEKVIIRLEASEPRGMPHPRYQGKVGTILGLRGRAYEIEFFDGGKKKIVIANPVHLVPMEKD